MSGRDQIFGRIFKLRTPGQDIVELEDNSAAGAGPTLELRDDQFYLVDPATVTKRVRFDAGSVTAATTRVITVPDYDLNLGSGVGGLETWVDTGGVFATPIVLTVADSGKGYLLDDAAGLDFTLPEITAATVGMKFKFRLVTEVTSNSYRITAGAAADLYVGHVRIWDKDAATGDANALIGQFRPDLSNDIALTITGSDDTQGSLVGGSLTFEAITAARWFVSGDLIGDGTLATVFS